MQSSDIIILDLVKNKIELRLFAEVDLEGGARGARPVFCNHLFFCNHFEELQTVNWSYWKCVYPNTIKTSLTLNHLLFGRQLLYYSNTTSTVVRNLTLLSSTNDKRNRMSSHFWHRWRHEYIVNLREAQRTSKLNINSLKIMLC